MAVPADADRATAKGSNRLLADGAVLVQSSDEIMASMSREFRETLNGLEREDFGKGREPGEDESIRPAIGSALAMAPDAIPGQAPGRSPSDEIGRTLDSLLREDHRPLDVLLQACAEAGFSHSAVVQRLLELEMSGVLEQLPGRIYCRRV
jgi:predicted Rossmann fold nucleotide-binding protein DprA/Smf involved in DNA uptake